MTAAIVREWNNDEGWGVIDSPVTPGGCWVHFTAIDAAGYRRLNAGDPVEMDFEAADQDGYAFRAVRVRLRTNR